MELSYRTFFESGVHEFYFEDRGETEKMGLTWLHSESRRIFKGIHMPNTDEKCFFLAWAKMMAWATRFL